MDERIACLFYPPALPRIQAGKYLFTVINVKPGKNSEKGTYGKCNTLRITLLVVDQNEKAHKILNILYLLERTEKFNEVFAKSLGVDFATIRNNHDSIKGLTGTAYFECKEFSDCFGNNKHRNLASKFYPKT